MYKMYQKWIARFIRVHTLKEETSFPPATSNSVLRKSSWDMSRLCHLFKFEMPGSVWSREKIFTNHNFMIFYSTGTQNHRANIAGNSAFVVDTLFYFNPSWQVSENQINFMAKLIQTIWLEQALKTQRKQMFTNTWIFCALHEERVQRTPNDDIS